MNLETDQLAEFYRKYRIIIWPVIVGLSCLLIAGLIIVPQLLVYFNLRSEAEDLSQRLGILQAKAQELEQLNEADYNENLELALAALPADKQIPQSLSLLQSMITQAGLSLENIKFSDSSNSPNNTENSFQLGVTVLGSMDSLKRLLAAVRTAPRIYHLESVNAQSVRTSNAIEADVSLRVFYEPKTTNLGAIDQPVPELSEADLKLLDELATKIRLSGSASASFDVPLGKSNPFQ